MRAMTPIAGHTETACSNIGTSRTALPVSGLVSARASLDRNADAQINSQAEGGGCPDPSPKMPYYKRPTSATNRLPTAGSVGRCGKGFLVSVQGQRSEDQVSMALCWFFL